MGEDQDKTPYYSELALKNSRLYGGKIETAIKAPVKSLDDFSVWYTPGVAAVSKAIYANRDMSFEMTNRWNTIAVISDGSRVLGLGNVGPESSLPVLEGKSLIFKYLGGVDAVPLPIATQKAEELVETVKRLEPAFGGINLEDIESPKCFYVLDKLRSELNIPVWHDDQLGTAGATLAGLYNALKLTGRQLSKSRIALVGAGAANIATARILMAAGAEAGNIILVDSRGILHPERDDIDELMVKNPWKYNLAIQTNKDRISGGIPEAMRGADVLISASKPGPRVIKKEWIDLMAEDPIVFAEANPVPEIWPHEAKEAGARIVATGRSDFPNQVNNSLVFPGVFRGALDARARTITDEMVIAAARELAKFAEEKGIREDYIIPTMEEWQVYPQVAAAVAVEAVKLGLARSRCSWDVYYQNASAIINRARQLASILVSQELIASPISSRSPEEQR